MKIKNFMLGMVLSLIAFSCNKKDDETVNFTSEEASINSKIDLENDDVSKIVDEQLTTQDGFTGKNSLVVTPFLPACASVVRVPATGFPVSGGTITKTVNFGTTGCTLPNGSVLKGKIILSFTYNPNSTAAPVVICTFEGFYHNSRKIEGTKTFTRTLSVATAASPSHPIFLMNMNLTIILADGRVLTRVGYRTSEITAGYATPEWNDNEYRVTGNWTTTFPNSIEQTSAIITPLLVKLSCLSGNNSPITQGTIAFNRNGKSATLDYGNGTCDNSAVFSYNGIAYNIVLGN
jgi:hypothetical protein